MGIDPRDRARSVRRKELPELARSLGQGMNEFRKAREEFDKELQQAGQDVKGQPQNTQPYQPGQPAPRKRLRPSNRLSLPRFTFLSFLRGRSGICRIGLFGVGLCYGKCWSHLANTSGLIPTRIPGLLKLRFPQGSSARVSTLRTELLQRDLPTSQV